MPAALAAADDDNDDDDDDDGGEQRLRENVKCKVGHCERARYKRAAARLFSCTFVSGVAV